MKSIVLINCDTSLEYEVKQAIQGMNIPIFACTGAYNFIVEVEANSAAEVRDIIWHKIRPLKGLRSTLTLAVMSTWKDFDE